MKVRFFDETYPNPFKIEDEKMMEPSWILAYPFGVKARFFDETYPNPFKIEDEKNDEA